MKKNWVPCKVSILSNPRDITVNSLTFSKQSTEALLSNQRSICHQYNVHSSIRLV